MKLVQVSTVYHLLSDSTPHLGKEYISPLLTGQSRDHLAVRGITVLCHFPNNDLG